MQDFAKQFFAAALVELVSLAVTLRWRDRPATAISALAIGTLLAGAVAFGPFWPSGPVGSHSPRLAAAEPSTPGLSQAPSPSPYPTPEPTGNPTPSRPASCTNPSAEWPKTPQEAAGDFGGQAFNWYPDYDSNGNWSDGLWVFQDSSLQSGVTLNADGDFTDKSGRVLRLPGSLRNELWNYGSPLTYPSLHLGQLGLAGRAQMEIRTGSGGHVWAMTKRWGYGSAVFDEAEGGAAIPVDCADDQLTAAASDALAWCADGAKNAEGYRILLWDEKTGRFESNRCAPSS